MKQIDPEKELIKRVKRRGGPFDTVLVDSTACLRCKKIFEKNLRWHYKQNGLCPVCGGNLNPKPLKRQLTKLIIEWKKALDSVKL